MIRKALIISNPGEPGAKTYCEGVVKDVLNYKAFLNSPLGGYWYDHEIIPMTRPSADEVRKKLSEIQYYDYTKIIFSGHGYYSSNRKSTILELKKGEELDSQELIPGTLKRTIILDCCRQVAKDIPLLESVKLFAALKKRELIPRECREIYETHIKKCYNFIVVMNACDINEVAGDSATNGGYYSSSLLDVSFDWSEKNIRTAGAKILDVADVHNNAITRVVEKSGGNQHPKIDKGRSEPYFPFAVTT